MVSSAPVPVMVSAKGVAKMTSKPDQVSPAAEPPPTLVARLIVAPEVSFS
jgi:hypothetical protein